MALSKADPRVNERVRRPRTTKKPVKKLAHYKRGLYAGSFDPMTYGHMDTIMRASARCDELIVLVAKNPGKKGLLTMQRRVEVVEEYIRASGLKNVRVVLYARLTADAYIEFGCDVAWRGVRDSKDMYEEGVLAEANRLILSTMNIQFIWQRNPALKIVSSSLLKMSAMMDVSVPTFAPARVRAEVEALARGVFRVGVIGGIACGKSTVIQALVLRLQALYGEKFVWHVNMDALLREAYDSAAPGSEELRKDLVQKFGEGVLTADGKVDRERLKSRVFGDTARARRDLRWLEELTEKHVMRLYRATQSDRYGICFIEMAQMLERGVEHLVCNRIIQVDSTDRDVMAEMRGIPVDRRAAVRNNQWNSEKRRRVIGLRIKAEGGFLIDHDNRLGDLPDLNAATLETPIPALDALVEQLVAQIRPYLDHMQALAKAAAV